MHPDDAKALQVIKRMRGADKIIRKLMELVHEQNFRGENLGEMISVNANNCPELYHSFMDVVRKVGIKAPELYLYNDPEMNAYTYGETNTFIALSSSLVERLEQHEVECIIAHECGHILCQHTLYSTLLMTLESIGVKFGIISEAALKPITTALQYWSRKSELSADRCAAAIVGERIFQTTLLKLTSGLTNIKGNPYQLVNQAHEYHRLMNESWLNRLQQYLRVAYNSHPQMCERAYEIDRWKRSWQYNRLRDEQNARIFNNKSYCA